MKARRSETPSGRHPVTSIISGGGFFSAAQQHNRPPAVTPPHKTSTRLATNSTGLHSPLQVNKQAPEQWSSPTLNPRGSVCVLPPGGLWWRCAALFMLRRVETCRQMTMAAARRWLQSMAVSDNEARKDRNERSVSGGMAATR